jgi:uncharacterized membrane protein YedE/YeeE
MKTFFLLLGAFCTILSIIAMLLSHRLLAQMFISAGGGLFLLTFIIAAIEESIKEIRS